MAIQRGLGLGGAAGEQIEKELLGFAPLGERVQWMTWRMSTTGRRLRSAWLLVGGTCRWREQVKQVSKFLRKRISF